MKITDTEDCTDAYKTAWANHIKRIDSKKGYQEHHKEGEIFNELCNVIAGRDLEPQEMKNILHSVSVKEPKYKINKYGQFFTHSRKDKNGVDSEIS